MLHFIIEPTVCFLQLMTGMPHTLHRPSNSSRLDSKTIYFLSCADCCSSLVSDWDSVSDEDGIYSGSIAAKGSMSEMSLSLYDVSWDADVVALGDNSVCVAWSQFLLIPYG